MRPHWTWLSPGPSATTASAGRGAARWSTHHVRRVTSSWARVRRLLFVEVDFTPSALKDSASRTRPDAPRDGRGPEPGDRVRDEHVEVVREAEEGLELGV